MATLLEELMGTDPDKREEEVASPNSGLSLLEQLNKKDESAVAPDPEPTEQPAPKPVAQAQPEPATAPGITAQQMADAIKAVESGGNYEAKGGSGEYGAYQFMPSTWKDWAGDLEPTPENQDMIAKKKFQSWIDQGMTAEEMAAKWNSGSHKGWEKKKGTNKYGVQYDVPAYVDKVIKQMGKSTPAKSEVPEIDRAVSKVRGEAPNPMALVQAEEQVRYNTPEMEESKKSIWQSIKDTLYDTFLNVDAPPIQVEKGGEYDLLDENSPGAQEMRADISAVGGIMKFSDLGIEQGKIYSDIRDGKATAEQRARLKELEFEMKQYEDDVRKSPLIQKGFGTLAPFYWETIKTSGKGALIGGTVFGIGTAILTAAEPTPIGETLAPITIPGAAAAGAKIGTAVYNFDNMYRIAGGMAYKDFTDMGMEESKAAAASRIVGSGEGILEMIQMKAGVLAKIPGLKKVANKKFADALAKVLGNRRVAQTAAKWAGNPIKEGGQEGIQELWGNAVELFATEIRKEYDEKDLSAQDHEELINRLSEGVWESFIVTVAGAGVLQGPSMVADVASISVDNAVATDVAEPGISLNVPEDNVESDAPVSQAPQKRTASPSVRNLMGLEDEGVSLSRDTNITNEQATKNMSTDEAVKDTVSTLLQDKVLKDAELKINQAEKDIFNLKGMLDDQVMMGDHEGALSTAKVIEQKTQEASDNYIKLVDESNTKLSKTDTTLPVESITAIEAHVNQLTQESQDLIQGQTTAVRQQQAVKNQAILDNMNTEQGLKQEMIDITVDEQTTTGKSTKGFNNIVTEMNLKDRMGEPNYIAQMSVPKMNKLRTDIHTQRLIDQRNMKPGPIDPKTGAQGLLFGPGSADTRKMAASDAALSWIDGVLLKKSEIDLQEARDKREEQRIEQVQLGVRREMVARGDRARAKEGQEVKRTLAQQLKEEDTARQEVVTEETITKLKKVRDTAEGRFQAGQAVKKVSQTERANDIKAEEFKAKRAEQKAAFVAKAKGKMLLEKQKEADKKKAYKQAELDRQKKVLEKPQPSVQQTKYMEEVKDARKRKVALDRMLKDNADLDTKSKLDADDVLPSVSPKLKTKAKQLFRAAAIKMPDGTVYEGTSHIDILDKSIGLDNFLKLSDAEANKVQDGFVTHDGQFAERSVATKMAGKKTGENLYSEDFLMKAVNHARKTGVKVDLRTSTNEQIRAAVMDKLTELDETPLTRPAIKLLQKFDVAMDIIASRDELPDSWGEARKTRFMGTYNAVYSPKDNKIYLNGKGLANQPAKSIQRTYMHEALHAALENSFRMLQKDKDNYRKKLRNLQQWWKNADPFIGPVFAEHARVQTFVNWMRNADARLDQAQKALEDGTGNLKQLDSALMGFEEALTYPFTDPEVAGFLNSIDTFQTLDNKISNKIKTLWDWLTDVVFKELGVAVRTGTAMSSLKDIADEIFQLPASMAADRMVRYNIEDNVDTSFDFGANVTPEKVGTWAAEMQEAAPGAAEQVVVADAKEFEEQFGFKPPEDASAVWLDKAPGKKEQVKGQIIYPGRPPLPMQVVYIADKIQSQEHFMMQFMHEQAGHTGLRNLFGDNHVLLNRFLQQAFGYLSIKEPELMQKTIETYDIGRVKPNGQRVLTNKEKQYAADEAIASKMAIMKPESKKGLVSRFKAFLKKWLPKVFVAKVDTFKMKDKDIELILESARESIFVRNSKLADMMSKALQDRAPKFKEKGRAMPEFMMSDQTYKDWAMEVQRKVPDLKEWYEQHVQLMVDNFGKDADLLSVLLALTSPQADVETNVQFAVDSYLYLMGLVDKPGHRFPKKFQEEKLSKWTDAKGVMESLESNNFKVAEFLRALLGDTGATVGDIWMYRAFFGDHAVHGQTDENPRVIQQVALREKLFQLANELQNETNIKWQPRDLQAAIWVYINAAETGKSLSEVASFKSGFLKPTMKYGGLNPMQYLQKMVPDVKKGPLSDKLGLDSGITQAPKSTLERKRLLQLTREDIAKTKPVKTETDAKRFINAQKKNKYSQVLTISKPKKLVEEIKAGERKVFITNDGQAGYSVDKNGDIGMVFSNSNVSGVGISLLAEAIGNGGRTLDAFASFDNFLPNFYRKTFGFKEYDRAEFDPQYAPTGWETMDGLKDKPDVVFMRLSDDAIKLFSSEKTGKVTKNEVLNKLGGFTGDFTREVRFSREARKNLDNIADMADKAKVNTADMDFIRTGNDGKSVLGKIHEWRDQSAFNIDRLVGQLEQEFLENFGGRKARMIVGSSGRKLNTSHTELLMKAMNLYIDSGHQLAKVKAYAKKLLAKGTKLTNREKDQIDIIERMIAMTDEERTWADSRVRPYYQEFFDFAKDHKILDSQVDNYVKRQWKIPEEWEDAGVTWSGSGTTGFKLTPSSGKSRTLDSIVDGWEMGLEQRADSVLANLNVYAKEIGYVFSNRRFVEYLSDMVDFGHGGLMIEVAKDEEVKDKRYKPVQIRGMAHPGKKIYALSSLANELNKLKEDDPSAIWDHKAMKTIRRINSSIKSTILSVSLFHHLAGMRSWAFGVSGISPIYRLRVFKAYREGLKKIDQQTGFGDDKYKHLGPIVDLLVREGLTIGQLQDFDEIGLQESFFEDVLNNRTGYVSRKTLNLWRAARRKKRSLTTGLFNRLFAGLKAEAASMELIHKLKQIEKKNKRPATEAEIKNAAMQTAELINADFGGLNLGRLKRNKSVQKTLQLALLAPDWTESNWRTVVGMMPFSKNIKDKFSKDEFNQRPDDMHKVYRKFWRGIAMRAMLSTALAQAAVLALAGDDDDREEYWNWMKGQFSSWKQFGKGKWTAVDITAITKRFGMGTPGKRQSISIVGHFKDILKVFAPNDLVKHKISPLARTGETLLTGTDWKGDNFTSLPELIETGSFVSDSPNESHNFFWSTLPSALGYNIRQSIPIFGSEFLQAAQGESSWLGAVSRMGGLEVRDNRPVDANEKLYWELSTEVQELDQGLTDAKMVGDSKLITDARLKIRRFDDGNFNKVKSRLGFTRQRLGPLNKQIKKIQLRIEEGFATDSEIEKLDRLLNRKQKIYSDFARVIERN